MKKPTLLNLITNYYDFVDDNDIKNLLSLFSEDIYYKRCTLEIRGIKELADFYGKIRDIHGKHKITNIIQDKNGMAIEGFFEGLNNNKDKISLYFADVFFFNEEGKISERHTYTDQYKI